MKKNPLKQELIRVMRDAPRGTQTRLARMLGVSLQQVQNLLHPEKGWTTPEKEEKIQDFLRRFEREKTTSDTPIVPPRPAYWDPASRAADAEAFQTATRLREELARMRTAIDHLLDLLRQRDPDSQEEGNRGAINNPIPDQREKKSGGGSTYF